LPKKKPIERQLKLRKRLSNKLRRLLKNNYDLFRFKDRKRNRKREKKLRLQLRKELKMRNNKDLLLNKQLSKLKEKNNKKLDLLPKKLRRKD
jgi:hypothetical protein